MSSLNTNLEFSKNTKISGQELLFDKSRIISQNLNSFTIPEEFNKDGYTTINDVEDEQKAKEILEKFIASIDEKKLPLYSNFVNKIQLAKIDLIPVCHDLVPRTFQALHFDMGQPIVSESTQTTYLILALYKPKTSEASMAKTRVVSIKKLLSQRKFGTQDFIEKKLIDYAQNHGDGWKEPTVVNTLRLALFARVLDAVTGRNKLTDEIDYTTGQWFNYNNDSEGMMNERHFFSECGLNLESAEEQINVKQGQLLIIDNMRCVHGRIGPRKPKEIYQFLFGIKSATPNMIDDFRNWLVQQFSKKI